MYKIKQTQHLLILCYEMIGRITQSYDLMKNLLDLYKSLLVK